MGWATADKIIVLQKWEYCPQDYINPLSPNIHEQILQTDLYTFL